MLRTKSTSPLMKKVLASAFAVSVLTLHACGDTGPDEAGIDLDEQANAEGDLAYDGLYDSEFYGELDSYDAEEVSVEADVAAVLSASSFTIVGPDDTEVDEMLVVGASDMSELEPGLTTEVTGTVHPAFDLATVEEMGLDLDDGLYEDWDGKPYIEASEIDTSVEQ